MDKNIQINNLKYKNESEILKEKKEDNSLRNSADISSQIIQDVQKNDMTASLNKKINNIKKKNHYYNKGNIYMFLFNKDSVPRIVIGPHCKKNKNNFNNIYNFNREICYIYGISNRNCYYPFLCIFL